MDVLLVFALLDAEGGVIIYVEAFFERGFYLLWSEDNILFDKEELSWIARDY